MKKETSFTDNEIIKALECCGDENVHFCSICPIYLHDKDNDFCQEDLHRMSLDLINRRKAEIERLNNNISTMAITLSNSAKGTRAEARKEFAAKLKKRFHDNSDSIVSLVVVFREINNLLEEMESESK